MVVQEQRGLSGGRGSGEAGGEGLEGGEVAAEGFALEARLVWVLLWGLGVSLSQPEDELLRETPLSSSSLTLLSEWTLQPDVESSKVTMARSRS